MERIRWSEIKTCQVNCDPRQFSKAIEIWVQKPHVVNRRLAASVTLGTVQTEFSTVNAWLTQLTEQDCTRNCEVKFKDYLSAQASVLNDSSKDSHVSRVFRDDDKLTNLLRVCGRKLIPKSKVNADAGGSAQANDVKHLFDNDDALIELVLFDLKKHEVTFVPLKGTNFARCAYKFSLTTGLSTSVVLSLPDDYLEPSSPSSAVTTPTTSWLTDTLLPKLAKWSADVDPDTPISSSHALISVERYSRLYVEIKQKYGPKFVKIWPENTDPQKFVYEDVAIATYILLLWQQEREEEQLQRKQSFVDLGCGNGLLVHILNSEGHPGKGIDLRSRGIWSLYGDDTHLEECSIIPSDKHLFPDTDWLIGNHSDELTPWIPVMAARSSLNTRYFVLPCCFHDFAGKFIRRNPSQTQYRAYLDFIREVGEVCDFVVEEDSMRIPSTKRICHVGKRRNKLCVKEQEILNQKIQDYIAKRCPSKLMRKPIANLSHNSSKRASSLLGSGSFENRNIVITNIHDDDIDEVDCGSVTNLERTQIEMSTGGRLDSSLSVKNMSSGIDSNPGFASVDKCMVNEEVQGQWAESFQPRSKVEAVRNCSKLSTDLKDKIVNDIADALLTLGGVVRTEEGEEESLKLRKLWRRGGKMTFQEVVALFDGDVMKQLKNECGGLKTLLKNANQVFEVQSNSVQLRDWSLACVAERSKPRKHKGHQDKKAIKTRQCWFYTHHPDGCPLLTKNCSFAHGLEDLLVIAK